jgi:hypothetical protein
MKSIIAEIVTVGCPFLQAGDREIVALKECWGIVTLRERLR